MTTDTLHDYDRLIDTGFSDEQARAVVGLLSSSAEPSPEVIQALELILSRLDEHGVLLSGLRQDVDRLSQDVDQLGRDVSQLRRESDQHGQDLTQLGQNVSQLGQDVSQLGSRLYIIDERMQSESRVQRMLNTTLIAIGALLGSLLAVFAR